MALGSSINSKWIQSEVSDTFLPFDLANLSTVVAQPWVQFAEGSSRPSVEGAIFDKQGNLYICHRTHPKPDTTDTVIVKIGQDGKPNVFHEAPRASLIGLAFHANGDLYAADIDGNRCFVIDKEGNPTRELLGQFPNKTIKPNDLAFDLSGNLYFNDFRGSWFSPNGAIFRLDAEEDYCRLHLVVDRLCSPNGIAFSPEWDTLWISETTINNVTLLRLDDIDSKKDFLGVQRIYRCVGSPVVDSLRVDSAGFAYVTMMYGGRAIVFNKRGIPVGNVIIPDEMREQNLFSPTLAIKPNSSEGYLVSSGPAGAWVYRFPTIASAMPLFSDIAAH